MHDLIALFGHYKFTPQPLALSSCSFSLLFSFLLHRTKTSSFQLKTLAPPFFPLFLLFTHILFLQFLLIFLLIMTTIVCQGLQSCHESPLAESRTLRLRFSPKRRFSQSFELALKPCFLDSNIKELSEKYQHPREEISTQKSNVHVEKHTNSNSDSADLTFLQIISNHSQCPKETTQQESNVYVHPSVKRPSTLSEKSLRLCTENLGSETGTEITDTSILSLSSSDFKAEDYVSPTMEKHNSRQLLVSKKKMKSPSSFPPPLTTMARGSEIQVRPHREDGRLIIEAVKSPSSHTYLHAERSNGRLLLSLVKDSCDDLDGPSFATSAQENEDVIENDMNYGKAQEEVEEEGENSFRSPHISSQSPQEEEENLKEVKKDECCGEEGMDGNEVGFGPEMGLEDFQRPHCRCNGELKNKGLINWERLWVASS